MTVGEIRSILSKHFRYDSDNDTYYLMDYHPYWHGHNPDFGDEDGVLLDFKKGYDSGITHFYKKLSYRLNRILDQNTNIWLCCVPSHSPSNSDSSVYRLISKLSISKTANLLKRTKEVEKLSTGGDRAIAVHANSIVTDTSISLGNDAIVVLMDDILTSGNSIKACKSILSKRKDVKSVISIVIAKTKNSRSYVKVDSGLSIATDDEFDDIVKAFDNDPLPVKNGQKPKKQSTQGTSKPSQITETSQRKEESMSDNHHTNVVAKPSAVTSTKQIDKKARICEKYRSRADDFRYGFFCPWVLLIMSIIFMGVIALTINRRLYYSPLVYMFVFTPMALFWVAPSSGIIVSMLAFIFKGIASLARRFQRYRACYYINKINRVLIMTISISIWVALLSMTIWYNLGIERSYEGPWEYTIFKIDELQKERDSYTREITWLLNAHRCPRCRSRSIYPISEYEGGNLPSYIYHECQEFFGGCRNVNINPVHECYDCKLIFRFNKNRESYIPAKEN